MRSRLPRRQWIVPVAAAAAVVAIAAAVVIVKDVRNGQQVPPASAASSQIPAYYVALNDAGGQRSPNQVVVGDTFTGARLGQRTTGRSSSAPSPSPTRLSGGA